MARTSIGFRSAARNWAATGSYALPDLSVLSESTGVFF